MEVICQQCFTGYILEDALIGSTGTTVRCSRCDNVFKVFRKAAYSLVDEEWMLRQEGGATYPFSRLSTLRKWILTGKVSDSDLLSRAGGPWKRLGEIAELRSSFQERDSEPVPGSGPQPLPEGSRDSRLSKIPLVVERIDAPPLELEARPPMAKLVEPSAPRTGSTVPLMPAAQLPSEIAPAAASAPGVIELSAPAGRAGDHTLRVVADGPASPAAAPQPTAQSAHSQPAGPATPVEAVPVVTAPVQPVIIQPVVATVPQPQMIEPDGSGPPVGEPASGVPIAPSAPATPVGETPAYRADFAPGASAAENDAWQTGQISQSADPAWTDRPRVPTYSDSVVAPLQGRRRRTGRWVVALMSLVFVCAGLYIYFYQQDEAAGLISLYGNSGDNSRSNKYYLLGRESFLLDTEASFREADREYQKVLAFAENDGPTLTALTELFAAWAQYYADDVLDARADALALADETGTEPDFAEAQRLESEFRDKLDEAKRWAERANIHAAGAIDTHRALGDVSRLAGNLEKARLHLDEAQNATGNSETEYSRALLQIDSGVAPVDVLRSLSAITLDDQLLRALYRKARVLASLQRYDEAGAVLDRLGRMNAEHQMGIRLQERVENKMTVYLTVDQLPAVEEPTPEVPVVPVPVPVAPRKVAPTEVIPQGIDGLLLRASELQGAGRISEAMELFEKVLERSPRNVDGLIGLGYSYLDRRSYGQAIAQFRRVLSVNSSHGPALLGVAQTYKAQGQDAQAIKYFQKYLVAHPSGRHVSRAQRNVEELSKREAQVQTPVTPETQEAPGLKEEKPAPAPENPASKVDPSKLPPKAKTTFDVGNGAPAPAKPPSDQ